MAHTLIVTNDFPPRWGGIETFVRELCDAFDPNDLTVYTARMAGAVEVDRDLPFDVRRDPTGMLLPTPVVARRVAAAAREVGADTVVYGAAAPLGLLAPALRRVGVHRQVAMTHGHEVWWAKTPGARALLGRVGRETDVVTYVARWCRDRIAPALGVDAAARMRRLSPGVDVDRFRPGAGGDQVRRHLGLGSDQPVVVCSARLVPRKGQDTLITAWPNVVRRVPGARLVLNGDGPDRRRLQRLAAPLGREVIFTGRVSAEEMPTYLDAGDVFAMPCRTRRLGLEAEAFGIVFLEAAACGLPVVVGDSGGAPETVEHGVGGFVVHGRDSDVVADRLVGLLRDPEAARELGVAGRARVSDRFTWDQTRRRLGTLVSAEPG